MSATDEQHGQLDTGYPHTLRPELHKALMARGIDYWVAQGITFWNRDDGCACLAYGYKADGVPKLAIKVVGFTDPEQAIAATLGSEEAYTREDVEGAFVSGYSLGSLPVGSDPRWDENSQTVDEHMAELGWVRAATLGDIDATGGRQSDADLAAENAKLRDQMERLVTLLRVDCDIDASWDGLRRFWSIGLTEGGCLMRDRACKAEAENAKLREACAELLKMAESSDSEWLHWPEMHDELRELGVEEE